MNISSDEFDAIRAHVAMLAKWLGEVTELNHDPRVSPAVQQITMQAALMGREVGADNWAYDLGVTLLDLRQAGADGARLGEAATAMTGFRLELEAPPEQWFGDGDPE